ncbi:rubredoxin [Mycolicibacterium novocastrense]|nr:rubredoxin [Mycolicibacterium novocastrense]
MISAQCPECGYLYKETLGDLREGFAPGTPWSAIPDDWNCPDCCVRDKVDFVVRIRSAAVSDA